MVEVNGSNVESVCEELRAGKLPPGKLVPPACATIRLYTPNGFEVQVPLAPPTDFAALFALAQAASLKALAAGWAIAPPAGLDAGKGEERESVGWVVRTVVKGRNGPVNLLHLYSANPGWVKPFLNVYLNTPDEVRAFEAASGLRVDDLPEYVGEGRLERGKSPKTDTLIKSVRRACAAVYGPHPKYDEAEAKATKAKGDAYQIPKRKFLRWADQAPAQAPAVAAPGASVADEEKTPSWLANEYRSCDDDDRFTELEDVRRALWAGANADEKRVMKGASDACRTRLLDGAEAVGGRR